MGFSLVLLDLEVRLELMLVTVKATMSAAAHELDDIFIEQIVGAPVYAHFMCHW